MKRMFIGGQSTDTKQIDRKEDIVFITDDNYVKPTIVAITSLIANKLQNNFYNIYILTANLSGHNRHLLKCLNTENVEITIIDKSDIISRYVNIDQNRHVTPAALLKFFLPEIFCNLDRILYLDSDILIQKGFENIFDIEFENNYAAVVKDILCKLNRKHMDKFKIFNEFYFNSGVLFLNLKKMREDNISQKLIDWRLNNRNFFMDQDTFNAVIGHNVKYISYKYNFLNYYLEKLSPAELTVFFNEYMPKSATKIYKSCKVVHLGGPYKPWVYNMGYLSTLYKKYYNQSLVKKEKMKLRYLPATTQYIKLGFSINSDSRGTHIIVSVMGLKIKIKNKTE